MGWKAAALAAVMGMSGLASAHELTCEKTVRQYDPPGGPGPADFIAVDQYPAWLAYDLTVYNVHPTEPSVLLTGTDTLFPLLQWDPPLPITIPVGGHVDNGYAYGLSTYELCLRAAGEDGLVDHYIDNTFTVTWDLGQAQCSARVECKPPPCTENCTPPGGPTRTVGFFQTHEEALQACLDQGPIDLNFVTVTTLEDALGILWGSPNSFDQNSGGDTRNTLERDRFLLARQLIAGVCNERLFGTTPTPSNLLDAAIASLGTTDCTAILGYQAQVDAYNNSGDSIAFPSGFDAGPATPQHAQSIADDPTSPGGQDCGD